MRKMNVKLAGLALLIFVLAACSNKTTEATTTGAAQTKERVQKRGERRERPQFADLVSQMDTDKDGKLSVTEVKGPLKENFSEIDTDKDGFLSEAEFESAPKPRGRKGN